MHDIVKEVKSAVFLFLAFSIITGLAYPFFITGIVQTAIPEKGSGSLIVANGKVLGSELIGQNFTSPGYFHGRPSAVGYSANGSGASNFGPTSARLMEQASQRIEQIRSENNLSQNMPVPGELVLASASGLDPHISMQGAMLQVPRIAKARGSPESEIKALVRQQTEPAQFGILGQERVNVLKLNWALDELLKKG
jgi:potassium-transporting ATPase KdpC subunit